MGQGGFGHGMGRGPRGGGKGRGQGCGGMFRGRGFRLTQPRRVIVEALEKESEYLSAEELHARIRESTGEAIGLATVYRTLQLLEEHGFLYRLESGEGRSRFKLAGSEEEQNRKVFICRRCRRSFPAGTMSAQERQVYRETEERMHKEHGFQVGSRVVHFFGLCGECAGETRTDGQANAGTDGA